MDKEVLIKSLKVIKNMEFTEKETIFNINNGPQLPKESVFLEILTTGTEKSMNAKEYDNF